LAPTDAPRFPAILDTGFNESFLIHRSHLIDWAGVQEQNLPVADDRKVRVYEQAVVPRDASLWLYYNLAFTQSDVSTEPPVQIEVDAGILISAAANKPRLPLIGMRAIESAGLEVVIDGRRQTVCIGRSAAD
jgi:hypothetical protein